MKYFRDFRRYVQPEKIIGKHKKAASKKYVPNFYIHKEDNSVFAAL